MPATTTMSTTSPASLAATAPHADSAWSAAAEPARLSPTVRLAAHMANTAYHDAGRRVQRLARQLLPQAASADERMRLLFLYAAEETYLASVFPTAKPGHPGRWQAGVIEHQLAAELAGMIATAEEAIAIGQPYRPAGFEPETAYVVDLMAHYVAHPDPVERAGMLDTLARHLGSHGYPQRATDLLTDVAAAVRIAAISPFRHPALPPAA
ncbi:MAG TPA: hypothetical protein VGL02_01245 [Streptomyces sp.]